MPILKNPVKDRKPASAAYKATRWAGESFDRATLE